MNAVERKNFEDFVFASVIALSDMARSYTYLKKYGHKTDKVHELCRAALPIYQELEQYSKQIHGLRKEEHRDFEFSNFIEELKRLKSR